MKIQDILSMPAEAAGREGPSNKIVLSSRVRLARNLAASPFPGWAKKSVCVETFTHIRDNVMEVEPMRDGFHTGMEDLSTLDKQILVERHFISREHAAKSAGSGMVLSGDEVLCVMINEEDHLRIQVLQSGLSLENCWQLIQGIDEQLDDSLTFAFSERLGYLTACPTNVGTGIRVSVMLHLPALVLTKEINKAFNALQKINLAVRGLYGEGSQAMGDFYQISNQITLGRSEQQLIDGLKDVIPNIIRYERRVRDELVRKNRGELHDQISRAYGILQTAQTISSEETMQRLSSVRMGINLELIDDLGIPAVNELLIHTQPAHLQKLYNSPLEVRERNEARATFLRRRLAERRAEQN